MLVKNKVNKFLCSLDFKVDNRIIIGEINGYQIRINHVKNTLFEINYFVNNNEVTDDQ